MVIMVQYCWDGNDDMVIMVQYCWDGNDDMVIMVQYCWDGNDDMIIMVQYCWDGIYDMVIMVRNIVGMVLMVWYRNNGVRCERWADGPRQDDRGEKTTPGGWRPHRRTNRRLHEELQVSAMIIIYMKLVESNSLFQFYWYFLGEIFMTCSSKHAVEKALINVPCFATYTSGLRVSACNVIMRQT